MHFRICLNLHRQMIVSYQGECRNMTCSSGKVLQNTSCVTAIQQIRGLAYSIEVAYALNLPLTLNVSSGMLSQDIERFIISTLSKRQSTDKVNDGNRNHGNQSADETIPSKTFVRQADLLITMETTSSNSTRNNNEQIQLTHLRILGNVSSSTDINRDAVEQFLVAENFFMDKEITIHNSSRKLTPVSYFAEATLKTSVIYMGEVNFPNKIRNSREMLHTVNILPKLTFELLCPYVSFTKDGYEILQDKHGNVTVNLLHKDTRYPVQDLRKSWQNDQKDVLLVCHETLMQLPLTSKDKPRTWQYMLTLVMMLLSAVCCLLILIVYTLLPDLRTEPGINIMGLCSTLLVAQITLLLAAHRAVTGTWCEMLGILVHTSWLCFFGWTVVCSWHMFSSFSNKTFNRLTRADNCMRLMRNILVTAMPSFGVACTVMIISQLTTGGTSLGYSKETCYLDGTLLVGLAMVLPVAILLTINTCLFALTVRKIHTVSKNVIVNNAISVNSEYNWSGAKFCCLDCNDLHDTPPVKVSKIKKLRWWKFYLS